MSPEKDHIRSSLEDEISVTDSAASDPDGSGSGGDVAAGAAASLVMLVFRRCPSRKPLTCLKGTPARWRDFHSATIIGSKMFVFGGRADRFGPFHSNNEIYCNKIKIFDTETNSWMNTASAQLLPEGRRSHSAFAYNGELYIFGGYNARLDRHFNDLWKFNPEAFSWRKVEPRGKGPCPRRRQCCCMVGDRIILFGGTSPCPEQGMGDEFNLMDHSDLYILDFSPNLKTLCKLAVIQYSLDQSGLPHDIRWELTAMTTNSTISRPIFSSHG
ncbi:kelch domain-containing protein [Pimephales promelas]|nr:kelch domain-containing protein [Pimephales promelas]